MSFFKKIVKTLSDSDTKLETNNKVSEDIKNSDVQTFPNDGDKDFKLLLALYKKNKVDDMDIVSLVREENLEATPHKCPYCSVIHVFKASRARKCPDCSKKMIVRQGLFITEDQAKNLEKKIQDFYDRQSDISQSGFSIEAAQDYRIDKDIVGYYRSIAEAFRFMAQVENQKNEKGFSFWDKAWNYYNHARLEEMKNLKEDMMEYSSLPNIFWDMSKNAIRSVKVR